MAAILANKEKVTVYYQSENFGGFGIRAVECFLLEHGTRKYAQYANAPYVTFIPKGKRKARQILLTYQPYLVIVEGWGHPSVELFEKVSENSEVSVSKSRYSSFSPEWANDNDQLIKENNLKIVADYRHSSGFRSGEALYAI